jgi:hypothetical protein
MIKEFLRRQLLDLRAEDLRVRAASLCRPEPGGPYVPLMEAIHVRSAARLWELIAQHGCPGEHRHPASPQTIMRSRASET